MSHATWTPELEDQLRRDWLGSEPVSDLSALWIALGEEYGRSPVGIRCHSSCPRQTCTDDEAIEIRRQIDAEYGR